VAQASANIAVIGPGLAARPDLREENTKITAAVSKENTRITTTAAISTTAVKGTWNTADTAGADTARGIRLAAWCSPRGALAAWCQRFQGSSRSFHETLVDEVRDRHWSRLRLLPMTVRGAAAAAKTVVAWLPVGGT
jgi:hypothetical protein